jgi:hypothetical protein
VIPVIGFVASIIEGIQSRALNEEYLQSLGELEFKTSSATKIVTTLKLLEECLVPALKNYLEIMKKLAKVLYLLSCEIKNIKEKDNLIKIPNFLFKRLKNSSEKIKKAAESCSVFFESFKGMALGLFKKVGIDTKDVKESKLYADMEKQRIKSTEKCLGAMKIYGLDFLQIESEKPKEDN